MGADMKDADRHRRDEDRKIEPEGGDQEQHRQHGLQVVATGHVAQAVAEAAALERRPLGAMQLVDAQPGERDEHGREREGIAEESPSGAERRDEQARRRRADQSRGLEGRGVQGHRIGQIVAPTSSETKVWRAGASKALTQPCSKAKT